MQESFGKLESQMCVFSLFACLLIGRDWISHLWWNSPHTGATKLCDHFGCHGKQRLIWYECQQFGKYSIGFHLSVVTPEPVQLLWPITVDVSSTMSQSGFEAIHVAGAKRGKMRMSKSQLVLFCFYLVEKVAPFVPTNNGSKGKPTKTRITFDAQLV